MAMSTVQGTCMDMLLPVDLNEPSEGVRVGQHGQRINSKQEITRFFKTRLTKIRLNNEL